MKYSTIYLVDCFPLAVIRYGLVVRIPGSHPGGPGSIPGNGKFFSSKNILKKFSTRMGFEPTRAEPIGLAVQRLNHSATSSGCVTVGKFCYQHFMKILIGYKICVGRESNPDQLLGRQLC